jgi:hypothetical protein
MGRLSDDVRVRLAHQFELVYDSQGQDHVRSASLRTPGAMVEMRRFQVHRRR